MASLRFSSRPAYFVSPAGSGASAPETSQCTRSVGTTATDVLLFFPRGENPIQVADKAVTLKSRFAPFHLSVKFPLKDMMYKGELAL